MEPAKGQNHRSLGKGRRFVATPLSQLQSGSEPNRANFEQSGFLANLANSKSRFYLQSGFEANLEVYTIGKMLQSGNLEIGPIWTIGNQTQSVFDSNRESGAIWNLRKV